MSLFDRELIPRGGNTKRERFANGEVVTKDWLYTYGDRQKRLKVLRELLADLSEKRLEAPTAHFGGVGNGDALPKGLDDVVGRFNALQSRYLKELSELLEKQELIEKWMEKLSPRERDLVRVRFLLGNSIMKSSELLGKSTTYITDMERRLFS